MIVFLQQAAILDIFLVVLFLSVSTFGMHQGAQEGNLHLEVLISWCARHANLFEVRATRL